MTSSSARSGAVSPSHGPRKIDLLGARSPRQNGRPRPAFKRYHGRRDREVAMRAAPCASRCRAEPVARDTRSDERPFPAFTCRRPTASHSVRTDRLIAALQAAKSEAISTGTIVGSKK